MQNPIYEEIGKKHGISAAEVEKQMSEALKDSGTDMAQLLYTLSDVLINNE